MATATADIDAATAIRRVNDTLQGPVIDVLAQLVPEIRAMPRQEAYERTLDDLDLLSRCFQTFRRERENFRFIVVDQRHRPVADDTAALSCGRTLQQVIAMVVRTCAKRYFRRRLSPETAVKPLAPRLHQVSPPTAAAKPKMRTAADELYDAIKDYLLHEWQVPLVPTYCDMTPGLVRALGPRLLDIREPERLRRILSEADEAAGMATPVSGGQDGPAKGPTMTPVPPTTSGRADERARLGDILSGDGKRLRSESFTATLLRPDVRATMADPGQMLRAIEILRATGGFPVKLLVAELGLRTDQLAVILLTANGCVGDVVYGRLFGQPGEADLVMRMIDKARECGISQASELPDCAAFVRRLFARAKGGAGNGSG
ncbi:MAG: hypothetical protein HY985_07970 [Magnetospirillum sp.]|nr:hypothetical protein [Magnetospirillum sp.]